MGLTEQECLLDIKLPKSRVLIDIRKALRLRLKNHLSYREIAQQLGCSKDVVHTGLKPFMNVLNDTLAIEAFEESEAKLLSGAKMQMFTYMTDNEVLKKASLNNLAYAYKEVDQVKRLEENRSTANINVQGVLSKIDSKLQDLEAERERLGD